MRNRNTYAQAAVVVAAAVVAAVLAIVLRLDHTEASSGSGWHHSTVTMAACLGVDSQGWSWYAYDDDGGMTSGSEGALSVEVGSSGAIAAFGADELEAETLEAWAQSFAPGEAGVGHRDNVAWWTTTGGDLRAVDAIVGCLR